MSRLSRQGFLGSTSDEDLRSATVGFVGLGGGGSHLAQQLAHVGIGNYVLVDPQVIDETNTNRLIGGTLSDVAERTPKVEIASRLIKGLEPHANITKVQDNWIAAVDELRTCDVILGAVDSLVVKDQLETFARKNLIPYIDMGMTVTAVGSQYLISGQVIRSMPGEACLRCLSFVTPEKLKIDAELYGDAGENPQVVWPNGLLASLVVGLCVELLSPWHKSLGLRYLSYDGNLGVVRESPFAEALRNCSCPHYPLSQVGQPRFQLRSAAKTAENSADSSSNYSPGNSWLDWLRRLLHFHR